MEMTDILANRVEPFEIEDEKLKGLFSYYLHLAPTIDSRSACDIPARGIENVWNDFLFRASVVDSCYHFYAPGNIKEQQLERYSLSERNPIKRGSKGFVCCRKHKNESNLECLLRHIRNSIAHSNVFILTNRRKFVLFDDFNKSGNQTARILLSQTDLQALKKALS